MQKPQRQSKKQKLSKAARSHKAQLQSKRKTPLKKSGASPEKQAIATYTLLEIRNLPGELEQPITAMLFASGCRGTEEVLDFSQTNLKYEPEIVPSKIISMRAYFDDTSLEQASLSVNAWVQSNSPQTTVAWTIQKNRDWLQEWKKHFKTLQVGKFTIQPAWEKGSTKSKRVIRIEPGMAFGTGTHTTTQFALELIGDLECKNKTFLDVGAGSGILSVAAEKMGASQSDAIDNDPTCEQVSHKNFKLNETKNCRWLRQQVDGVQQSYDIVCANIIDGVLMDLKTDLKARVQTDGFLILSGILSVGLSAFARDFFEEDGGQSQFEILTIKKDSEWAALLARKK